MPSLGSVSDFRNYHITSYGTFLGSTFFQSFVASIIAYRCLPRAQFARLQEHTVPAFFTLQSVLAAIAIITFPGKKLAQVGGESIGSQAGLRGLLEKENRWTALVPLATMFVTSIANLAVVGPATTKTMKSRHHQETRDGKKSDDAGPHSPEMEKLNRRFNILHSASAIMDLAGLGAALLYGVELGERL